MGSNASNSILLLDGTAWKCVIAINSEKDATYLTETVPCNADAAVVREKYGSIFDLDEEATAYYFVYFEKTGVGTSTATPQYAILIEISPNDISENHESDYKIELGPTSLKSGFKAETEQAVVLGDSIVTVDKTYLLSYTEKTFSLKNSTGSLLMGSNASNSILLLDGTAWKCVIAINSEKDATYLTETVPCNADAAVVREKYGSIFDLDEEATAYYFVYFEKTGVGTSTATPQYAILIEISPNGTPSTVLEEVSKAALEAEIAKVTGDNAENYHQIGDRYNGKKADTITDKNSGFWKKLTADSGPLKSAQEVFKNVNASKDDVDAAVTELSTAIAKLIPASQINATALYEGVHAQYQWRAKTVVPYSEYNQGLEFVSEDNTSESSWKAYQAAKAVAQVELEKLFYQTAEQAAEEGKEVGDPTPYNSSTSGDAADNVAKAVADLNDAVAGLDKLAGEDRVTTGQIAYDSLKSLATRCFVPEKMTSSAYTEENWAKFLTACDDARTFLNTHSRPTEGAGENEVQASIDAYTAFWTACYEGLESAGDSVNVTLSVSDGYSVAAGTEASPYAGLYELSLPSTGATLADALQTALRNSYSFNNTDSHYAMLVYVNGVYIQNMRFKSVGGALTVHNMPACYQSIRLKDGDSIMVTFAYTTVWTSMLGYETPGEFGELLPKVEYLQFASASASGTYPTQQIEADGGTENIWQVSYTLGAPYGYNSIFVPKPGARVFISDVCATRADALTAVADNEVGVTDDDGELNVTLASAEGQSEGWYLLTAIGSGDNGSLAASGNLLVHVTDPEDISDYKAKLKAALTELLDAYDDSFYTEAQLTSINSAYETGIAGINAAGTSGSAKAACDAAEQQIRDIQSGNTTALESNLEDLRFLLSALPTVQDAELGRFYVLDVACIAALKEVYAGMSDYQREQILSEEQAALDYYLTLDTSNLAEKEQAVTISLRAVDANTGEELTLGREDGQVPLQLLYYALYKVDGITKDADSGYAYGDKTRTALYNATFPEDPVNLSLSIEQGYHTGNLTWGFPNSAHNVSGGNAEDYITNGYEIVDSVLSVDTHYIEEGKITDGFSVTHLSLTAPRENVVITAYVRQREAVEADTYAEQLTDAFNTYNKNDYTAANWTALLDAYNDGLDAIAAADTAAEKEAALEAAVATMGKVPQKTDSDKEIDNGVFNAGKQIGTVTVTVENNTFPEGDFTGLIVSFENYPIGENDNMMTVILRALAEKGFTWNGGSSTAYSIGYLSSIEKGEKKLGEFSGASGSGWMGCLNDFMVNEGFNMFDAASGKLSEGDIVSIMFTQNMGVDLGGTWGNQNTTLENLDVSGGSLVPGFSSGEAGNTYDFALLISGSSGNVKLTPTAANKNYLVKTFLNEKVKNNNEGNSFYKRTEYIPVRPGDVIYVGVGEYAWPSMNKQAGNTTMYYATWYALHVISADSGADYVNELIAALPAAKNVNTSNYRVVQEQITAIDAVITELSGSEKAKVNTEKLDSVREIVEGFAAVQALKTEIAALPRTIEDTVEIRAAVDSANTKYGKLTAAQKNLLTVAETNKLLKAVNTLTLIDELKAIGATKDFVSTEANTEADVMAALRTWLQGKTSAKDEDVIISITGFTDANSSRDGSYTATVSFTLGSGSQAATQEKAISGTIKRSSDAGVSKIVINGKTTASGSGTSWTATLPYGSDPTKATFAITAAEKATPSAPVMAKTDGSEWTFTVTAEDGTKKDYTVKLSASEVKLTVLDSNVYDVSDDTVVTALSPVAVSGLDAIVADDLDLPEGTKEASVWLMLKIKAQSSDELTLAVTAWYAADGKEADKIPDDVLKNVELTLTVPLAGTEYAKVLYDSAYLDAKGSSSGITFDMAAAGDYTLIPDAHIAIVTFHEFDGTNNRQIVFYRGDAGKALPEASKSGAAFKGWYAKADCTGDKYTTVSATLPTDLYPLWSYGVKTEEVGDIEDRVEVSAIVQGDVATITVESKKPCAVIVEKPDGSFERLEVVNKNADGSYDFVQEDYDADMVFYVAALGDYDENGVLEPVDLTAANLTIIGDVDLEPLSAFIMGAKDGKLRTVDLAKLFLHLARNDVEW